MGVEIIWTIFSKRQLTEIYHYYIENASLSVAQKLILGIVEESKRLVDNYEIGQREEFLLDRNKEFRYIVFKKYKIIYWYNAEKSRIEISDVFDTRQNPVKIKRKK